MNGNIFICYSWTDTVGAHPGWLLGFRFVYSVHALSMFFGVRIVPELQIFGFRNKNVRLFPELLTNHFFKNW